MSSLVLELQAEACSGNVRVSDLLRKALVISKKLGISEIEHWINKELAGYPGEQEIPDYREVHGQVKAWNPYNGWVPVNFGDHEMATMLSRRHISQAVRELDALIEDRNKSSGLQVPFPPHIVNSLMRLMEVPLQPCLHVAHTEIIGILDAVRNIVLQWALELEQRGVLGQGMSFSKEERMAASKITYRVTNYIGSMSNSQLQQHSPHASQVSTQPLDVGGIAALLEALKATLPQLPTDERQRLELTSEIRTLEAQIDSPKPKKSIVAEALTSVRAILEGFAGNVLASDLVSKVNVVLQAVT